jgi:hypothetical protein
MDVGIEYKLGGRRVSQKKFFEGIEGQIRKLAVDGLIDRATQVTCPKHGKRAEVSKISETSDGFSFQISGCCDDLVERARSNLT